jgi:hypothetical protein
MSERGRESKIPVRKGQLVMAAACVFLTINENVPGSGTTSPSPFSDGLRLHVGFKPIQATICMSM